MGVGGVEVRFGIGWSGRQGRVGWECGLGWWLDSTARGTEVNFSK